jgi:hypothetical protein
MIHLIYLYLIINSFILGAYITDHFNDDSALRNYLFSLIIIFFGAIILLGYFIFVLLDYLFRPISVEITFQYKMYFTDYFDKIYLDDKYTDLYDSREKKLKKTEELAQNSSKQMQRHNKQIQKKYGK